MRFGMLDLTKQLRQIDDKERQEVEEFTIYLLRDTLTGGFPREAYLDMGFRNADQRLEEDLRVNVAEQPDSN